MAEEVTQSQAANAMPYARMCRDVLGYEDVMEPMFGLFSSVQTALTPDELEEVRAVWFDGPADFSGVQSDPIARAMLQDMCDRMRAQFN